MNLECLPHIDELLRLDEILKPPPREEEFPAPEEMPVTLLGCDEGIDEGLPMPSWLLDEPFDDSVDDGDDSLPPPHWPFVEPAEPAPVNAWIPQPQDCESPLQQAFPVPSVWRELGALGVKIGAMAGIVLIFFTLMYGLHHNVDFSMHPAVKDGDLILYYRWDRNYRAGDLLLLEYQGKRQVRRVVAIAGDTVDITNEGLVVNNALQQERNVYRPTERYANGIDLPITLGENEVFVLGDMREGVTDSRVYGAVNIRDTRGIVISILRRRGL